MEQWMSKETMVWVSTVSGVALVAMAIVIPWLIVRMPEDYFSNPQRYNWLGRKPAVIRIPVRVLKNVLAFALVILGVVMFLTPASGLFLASVRYEGDPPDQGRLLLGGVTPFSRR